MNDKHFDAIVIGAGVLGTFHAWHAARAGKKVLLLEKDQYPIQATVRNFGQIVPSGMSSDWFEFGVRGTALYKEIQKSFDISVRNNGSLYIASDQDETQLIHELFDVMRSRSYPCSLLSAAECLTRWPALRRDYCREALFFPTEISVEPDLMIHRILEFAVASQKTLSYRPSTTVTGCSPSGTQVIVSTHDGQLFTGDKAIICNGGEFKLLFPELFRRSGIEISKLQMMRTMPFPGVDLSGNILTGLTIRRYESFQECASFQSLKTPSHLKPFAAEGIHILFKQAVDNSIIIGDSHEYAGVEHADDLGFTVKQHINDLMLNEASRIVNFDVHRLAATWAGFYPQHPDKDIVEEDLEDCIHIRTAIGGKGMTSGAGYSEASIRKIFDLS